MDSRAVGVGSILVGFVLALPACAEPDESDDGPSASESTGESGNAVTTTGFTTNFTADDTGGGGGFSCNDPEDAVDRLFRRSCGGAGCHGGDAAAGLDLFDDRWIDQLVDQPSSQCEGWIRVVPGDPAASVLFDKLGTPACGLPMPVGQPLEADEIACVEAWIVGLAPPGASSGSDGSGTQTGGDTETDSSSSSTTG